MKFLLNPVGSHGDVLPILGLGLALQRRGYSVRVYLQRRFERHAKEAGLDVKVLNGIGYDEETLRDPDVLHLFKIQKLMAQISAANAESAHQAMREDIRGGEEAVTVGTSFSFAGRLLRETDAVPTVTLHLSSSMFRSCIQPPRLSPLKWTLPSFLLPLAWSALDRWLLDPVYGSALNAVRKKLGLTKVKRLFDDWMQQPDVLIGMLPTWFVERQLDWPSKLQLTDFPLCDHGREQTLPQPVRSFLDAGDAPIGFAPGTFTASAREFFTASVDICRRMKRRGILLSPFVDQVPHPLPDGLVHFDYVPFGALLPHLAAVVHHGGIGTSSQALRAGIPQLVRPLMGDQFENSKWLLRLGVAREVSPQRYAAIGASVLAELIEDSSVRSACARCAARFDRSSGIDRTCDAILASLKLPSTAAAKA